VSVASHTPSAAPIVFEKAELRSWKAPIALGVLSVVAVIVFGVFAREGTSHFGISTASDFFQIPDAYLPTAATGWVLSVLLVAIAGYSFWRVHNHRKVQLWVLIVFAALFLLAFLTWVSAGAYI